MMRILIADDHTIVREGVRLILSDAYPDASIVDVPDSASAVEQALAGHWDIIICDISMPPGDSGLEAIRKIKEVAPSSPIIILSMHAANQYALRVLKAGAMGYLTKSAATKELVKAVECVRAGKKYLSPDVVYLLADAVGQSGSEPSIQHLSEREMQVFRFLAEGKTVSEIARVMELSHNSINTFRIRVFEKMGFKNNVELIKYALDNQLV